MKKQNPVDSTRIIYSSSNFAKKALFTLQEIGSLTALLPHSNVRTGLNSFLVLAVLSGKAK